MKIKYPTEKQIERHIKKVVKFSKSRNNNLTESDYKRGENAYRNGVMWAIMEIETRNKSL